MIVIAIQITGWIYPIHTIIPYCSCWSLFKTVSSPLMSLNFFCILKGFNDAGYVGTFGYIGSLLPRESGGTSTSMQQLEWIFFKRSTEIRKINNHTTYNTLNLSILLLTLTINRGRRKISKSSFLHSNSKCFCECWSVYISNQKNTNKTSNKYNCVIESRESCLPAWRKQDNNVRGNMLTDFKWLLRAVLFFFFLVTFRRWISCYCWISETFLCSILSRRTFLRGYESDLLKTEMRMLVADDVFHR